MMITTLTMAKLAENITLMLGNYLVLFFMYIMTLTFVTGSPSALRNNLQGSLADLKYDGVRITRGQLGGNDDDEEMFSDDSVDSKDRPVTSEEEGDTGESENEQFEDGHSDHRTSPHRTSEANVDENKSRNVTESAEKDLLSSTLKRAREEERKKGKAVARQLVGTLFILELN